MSFSLDAACQVCLVADAVSFTTKCSMLFDLLKEAGERTNLTRILDEKDYLIKHVVDSLMIAKFFPELASEPLAVADIGCGAGFPSLVLALAYPRLKITAIDSTGKKIDFVSSAASALGLRNIVPVQGRACELNRKREWAGRFNIITARAVGNSKTMYSDTCNMLKKNGRHIFYKTPGQAESEISELSSIPDGPTWKTTPEFSLPENAGTRLFIYASNI
ncbi:MAG: 16S rRNA (guanine(527)-N(7))-methyltransferase RsmG [Lentisphaerae bacterium GWF2_45_14]|nr:MAG: 16S rRNA (guanine(527)-N(7))-methyltransferase RsmG [Lentisphaerae bacterium GWF2_45_14]